MELLDERKKCKREKKECGYFCKHNKGCALLLFKNKLLLKTINQVGKVDCEIYDKVIGIKKEDKVKNMYDRVIKRLNLKVQGKGKGRKQFFKSVRFGYDIFEAIDSVEGNSFNEVFQNICIDYIKTIPERKAKVEQLDNQIEKKKKQLEEVEQTLGKLQGLTYEVKKLHNQFNYVNEIIKSLKE